jgi:hypothetical protein
MLPKDSRDFAHHLSFRAGDVIQVESRHPKDEWLVGRLHDRTGSEFSRSCMVILTDIKPCLQSFLHTT